MNLTRRQLKAQYDRAVNLGWLPYFEEAARTITKGYFDTADLLAIGSRETNLDPKWLRRKGDNGHGCGLMQIDDRSFPEFTSSTKWQDARLGILKGAEVLMQKWWDYEQNIGKRVSVKGKTYTGKAASGQTAQHIVISSYNCGRWAQYAFANGKKIDSYSTGHDYGADVMERAAVIRTFSHSAAVINAQKLTGNQTIDSTNPPQTTEKPANGAAAEQPTQVAEQIINTGDTDVPKIVAAQNTEVHEVEDSKKTGIVSKIWAFIILVFTGQATLPNFVTDSDSGFWGIVARIFVGLWEFKLYLLGALFIWFIVIKFEATVMKAIAAKYNTDPTRSNILLVPPSKKTWLETLKFW